MNEIKIANEIKKRTTITKVVKKALWAKKCAGCGKVFDMDRRGKKPDRFSSLGYLTGMFDQATPENGNQLEVAVCSHTCAANLVDNEGWKKIKEYKALAKSGACLVKTEYTCTTCIDEKTLLKEWEDS